MMRDSYTAHFLLPNTYNVIQVVELDFTTLCHNVTNE